MKKDATTSFRMVSRPAAGPLLFLAAWLLASPAFLVSRARAQSTSCPTNLDRLAKYEWSEDDNAFHFEDDDGGQDVVMFSNFQYKDGEEGELIAADFDSEEPISAFVVKGGPDSKTETFSPPVESGTVTSDGLENGGGNQPAISHVLFCASPGTLPVELAGFTGRADGRTAVLKWKTLSEENSRGFYIEQKDGEGWTKASALIEGAGTSQTARRYSHRVEDLSVGAHTFRLRQVDFDDTEKVLDRRATVEVQVDEAYTLEGVYPNPFQRRATVAFAVREAQAVTVALYNALGQRVRTLREENASANETVTLHLEAGDLASGVYFVRLRGEHFAASESVTLVR